MVQIYCMCTVWGEPLSQTAQSFMPELIYGVNRSLSRVSDVHFFSIVTGCLCFNRTLLLVVLLSPSLTYPPRSFYMQYLEFIGVLEWGCMWLIYMEKNCVPWNDFTWNSFLKLSGFVIPRRRGNYAKTSTMEIVFLKNYIQSNPSKDWKQDFGAFSL